MRWLSTERGAALPGDLDRLAQLLCLPIEISCGCSIPSSLSLLIGQRTVGFLVVGAGRGLRTADRQLILTSCALL